MRAPSASRLFHQCAPCMLAQICAALCFALGGSDGCLDLVHFRWTRVAWNFPSRTLHLFRFTHEKINDRLTQVFGRSKLPFALACLEAPCHSRRFVPRQPRMHVPGVAGWDEVVSPVCRFAAKGGSNSAYPRSPWQGSDPAQIERSTSRLQAGHVKSDGRWVPETLRVAASALSCGRRLTKRTRLQACLSHRPCIL